MARVTPFLWFDTQAEAAANYYVSLFSNSKVGNSTKYGLSWQINPAILGEMLNDRDPQKAKRVMEAMLKMKKIDIAGLKRAYDQQ
jgi:predicted 3-demethylubiquinone-9 3-methyltransferase (glyoxalase superfamily)